MTFARLVALFNAALTQDVVITIPGLTTDAYNNQIPDWGAGATTVTEKGLLQQSSSAEDTDDRDTVVTGWELFLTAATAAVATARVVVDGRRFEVDGIPDVMRVSKGPHHVQAKLVSIDG